MRQKTSLDDCILCVYHFNQSDTSHKGCNHKLVIEGLLFGRAVVLSFFDEELSLPFMRAGQPILAERGRWADPRVLGNTAVPQGLHVREVKFDLGVRPINSTDGPVTRDENFGVVRHTLEQLQCSDVIFDRGCGVVVRERDEDVRKHVASDENATILDQQRRMTRDVRLMRDNPHPRPIPRNVGGSGR